MKLLRFVPVFLAFVALPSTAFAQVFAPCDDGPLSTCPGVGISYFERQPCASGVCNRSTAPTLAEVQNNSVGVRVVKHSNGTVPKMAIRVCAPHGTTLIGTGKLRIWQISPWEPFNGAALPQHTEPTIADNINTAFCGAVDGTTPTTCQCVNLKEPVAIHATSDKFIVQAVDVGVSGNSNGYIWVQAYVIDVPYI